MTRVVIETASLVDAVRKACQVAPSRGAAFDKAAGVFIEIYPGEDFPVILRATNLDVYFMQWIPAVEVEGKAAKWRVASSTLLDVANSLPMSSGAQVTLQDDGQRLRISQRRINGRLNVMIAGSYPIWQPFDPTDLKEVTGLASAMQRVEWAAAKGEIIAGIRFNGENIVATDKYKVAAMPMELDLEQEFVIRAKMLSGVLPPNAPVRLGFNGDMMQIMPDDTTQVMALAMAGDYIKIDSVMNRKKPNEVRIHRASLISMLNRALSIKGSDRNPILRVFIGREEVAAFMSNDSLNELGDVIETPGYADHKRVEIRFTPDSIIPALDNSPGDDVTLLYDLEHLNRPVYIKGEQGYECWVAVKRGGDND